MASTVGLPLFAGSARGPSACSRGSLSCALRCSRWRRLAITVAGGGDAMSAAPVSDVGADAVRKIRIAVSVIVLALCAGGAADVNSKFKSRLETASTCERGEPPRF